MPLVTYVKALIPYEYATAIIYMPSSLLPGSQIENEGLIKKKRKRNIRYHKASKTWQVYIPAIQKGEGFIKSKGDAYTWQPLPSKYQPQIFKQWQEGKKIELHLPVVMS